MYGDWRVQVLLKSQEQTERNYALTHLLYLAHFLAALPLSTFATLLLAAEITPEDRPQEM